MARGINILTSVNRYVSYLDANNFTYDVREGERNCHIQVIQPSITWFSDASEGREGLKWFTSKIQIAHDICTLISSHLAWKSDLIYLQNFKTVEACECSLGNVYQSISSETSVDFGGEGRERKRISITFFKWNSFHCWKMQYNYVQTTQATLRNLFVLNVANTLNFQKRCWQKSFLRKKWNKLLYNNLFTRCCNICIYSCLLIF